jgi:hypothetical protein
MISLKERGGCVTAAESAKSLSPAKNGITNILDEIVCSNVSKDSIYFRN